MNNVVTARSLATRLNADRLAQTLSEIDGGDYATVETGDPRQPFVTARWTGQPAISIVLGRADSQTNFTRTYRRERHRFSPSFTRQTDRD